MNLAHNLEMSARFYPDHPAVREHDKETSYCELNERSNRVASALVKLGMLPGDLVALCAPNSADWMAVYFGVLKMGAVATTLSSLLTSLEFSNLINHARPRAIYANGSRLATLQDIRSHTGVEIIICPDGDVDLETLMTMGSPSFRTVERERRDAIAVLYTGGTTGSPKGVILTQEGTEYRDDRTERFSENTIVTLQDSQGISYGSGIAQKRSGQDPEKRSKETL